MNCTKKITLTGYLVKYADLREPKPRTIHEEVYTLDKDGVDALALTGLNVADFITSRYERGGYHVTSVERITPKRVIMLDLCQLWTEAALPTTTTEEAAATCLWDIAAELDDIHVQFHQVRNMLCVYDELLEGELDFFKKHDYGLTQHFVNRYDIIRSVMEVMMLRINDAIDAMQVQINALYEADRKARPRATE